MKNKSNTNSSSSNSNSNSNKRFSSLKEDTSNPFKRVSREKSSKINYTKDQQNNQMNNQPNEDKNSSKVYVPISKRNKMKETTQNNSLPKQNIFIKSPKIENIKTDDETLFPSLEKQNPATPLRTQGANPANPAISDTSPLRVRGANPATCWFSSSIKNLKSKESTENTESNEPVRPGWLRITKTKNIYGPQNNMNIEKSKKRTEFIRYYEFAKRHKKIVMDDLELYGDEYYYKFGDPEELLNDDDSLVTNDEDELSNNDESSCDGYESGNDY